MHYNLFTPTLFTPSACFGHLALILTVISFAQKKDVPFKSILSAQSFAYCVHFALLGNPTAAASAFVNGLRNAASVKTQSKMLGGAFVVLAIAFGFRYAHHPLDWLTVFATVASTIGLFTMNGLALRFTMFTATVCWLINNFVCHSVDGIIIETFAGTTNIVTMTRLALDIHRKRSEALLSDGKGDDDTAVIVPR